MTEYKNGDTVRVVLEGKVVDLYTGPTADLPDVDVNVFYIEADPSQRRGLYIDTSNEAVKSVEVLESPLKVGDTVRHTQYALLPVGTVVQGQSVALWKLSDGSWADPAGLHRPVHGLLSRRTIKYLPE